MVQVYASDRLTETKNNKYQKELSKCPRRVRCSAITLFLVLMFVFCFFFFFLASTVLITLLLTALKYSALMDNWKITHLEIGF